MLGAKATSEERKRREKENREADERKKIEKQKRGGKGHRHRQLVGRRDLTPCPKASYRQQ